ncbi:MAG TPA: ABC transporter permease [Gemmatimonadaceae bacterium]|nr:ABC transporter permease [Gemmatimonadaceae bacterium]
MMRRLFSFPWRSRRRIAADVENELAFHMESRVQELVAGGVSPEEARTRALTEFGDVDDARRYMLTIDREIEMSQRRREYLGDLIADVRYAGRRMRSAPGFTAAIVLTLALGIGANATMFGVVDRLLFRPPPLLKDAESTHRIYVATTNRGKEYINTVGRYVRFEDYKRWTSSFSDMAGYTLRPIAIGTGEGAREMSVGVVSHSFFRFFDAPPALGRYFAAAEDTTPEGAPVVVLSHTMWQTQYGGRGDVLGSAVQIGPVMYTVIGVAPQGFVGLTPDRPPVAYIPITTYGARHNTCRARGRAWYATYGCGWMSVIARRKPGVTLEQASADLAQAHLKSFEEERQEFGGGPTAEVARPRAIIASILPHRGPMPSMESKVSTWVAGVSVIVLLVACANVANLLLARAIRRRREIAMRLALGVSRARLLSQLFTESVVLAVLAGGAGLLVAQWGGGLVRNALLDPSEAPWGLKDTRTVLFTLGAAMVVGLITGLAPAMQSRDVDLVRDLKSGAREGMGRRSRTRTTLLVAQAALSVILLVGAGLFVRSLWTAQHVHFGYDVDPVLVVALNMRGATLDSAQDVALRERLRDVAATVPGVASATRQTAVPLWSNSSTDLFVTGIDTVDRLGQFNYTAVSPDFFQTIGTRLLRGRPITIEDQRESPRVAVVSQNMARVLWPGRDAIGQCMRVGDETSDCTTIVGVAENIIDQSFTGDSMFYYYLPITQVRPRAGGLFVRVQGNATDYQETVRRALQREMPGAAYVTVTPFDDIVSPVLRSLTMGATMFVAFGAMALLIAAIGLYSVIAYSVAQRTHELGVRLALGARGLQLGRLVIGDAVRVAGIGVAIGVVVALWAARWLEPLLYEVSARDALVYVVVAGTLLVVSVAASWIPARRAARTDPSVALRAE